MIRWKIYINNFVQSIIRLKSDPFYTQPPEKGSGIRHFIADPKDGSACKRLNLFLRWMVRKDALDLGLWSEISPKQLIIPLDTHISRFGQYLGLTKRVSPGWRMALDITASLRKFDTDDPVKYDFAICTLGKLCSNSPTRLKCERCPMIRFCKEHKHVT